MSRTLKTFFLFLALIVFVRAQNSVIDYDNNPSAGNYAPINGIRLYYETYGSGKPLLLLHGNGGSIKSFKKQIPFFSKFFRVIAVDSRLQGKSSGTPDSISYELMASDFCQLINYLKLDSVYVLGWSDGGIDAILMALNCPGKIAKIAVSGANIVPDSNAVPYSSILEMQNLIDHDTTASKTTKALNKMMLFEPNIPFESLKNIPCPVLVMAGDRDIIKPEHTLKIFQSLPRAYLCIFPNSHHGVCQQHPDLFNQTVYDFFMQK